LTDTIIIEVVNQKGVREKIKVPVTDKETAYLRTLSMEKRQEIVKMLVWRHYNETEDKDD
tara:strand:+ start:455 stop:634 length:180 start_codon:yes stop_codon:yes gene_type:complete